MAPDASSEIVWEDPPNLGRRAGNGSWALLAAELKKHPGKWAIAGEFSYYNTYAQGKLKRLGCEAVNRKSGVGEFTLYARWPEDAS